MEPDPHIRPDAVVRVRVEPAGQTVEVAAGSLLSEAVALTGTRLGLPCGGQGRCGRCAVLVQEGSVRRRSTLRLSEDDIERGFALACMTVVTGDATVWVPPQRERLERVVSGDLAEKGSELERCDREIVPWVTRYHVKVEPPTLDDNTPDLERLMRELARQHDMREVLPTLRALDQLPRALRDGEWNVTVELDAGFPDERRGWMSDERRLLNVLPGHVSTTTYGVAIDVGTTTVVTYLADLSTGQLLDAASAYNEQISCGEDVISRIMYARQPQRRLELQQHAIDTINALIDEMLAKRRIERDDVSAATVAGNTTMIHLLLGLDASNIRLEPYVGVTGHFPSVPAARLGLHMNPEALVDCLPAVGAYVGGDITAGVLRANMHREEPVTLFMDIGTNGEMVLGNSEWLITCACSAGPSFEGAGAASGMRAVKGAVDEVWIDPITLEPTFTTIEADRPRGICGSGMISLVGEMLVTTLISKSGRINADADTDRVRMGPNGLEYVLVWAKDTATGEKDIVLDEADIANLIRAKAAIYAGAAVLCESVGLTMADVDRVLIGGSFGRHVDVEKAILIGLMPDIPWDRFTFLGNTSLQGAFLARTCQGRRAQVDEVASKMAYLELSADNRFMEAFTSALFLPHTDESLFPSVQKALNKSHREGALRS